MRINKVRAVYFSPAGTTRKIVEYIAEKTAASIGTEHIITDFTKPGKRRDELIFSADELVIFGLPVVAGRVPNVLLKYLSNIQGNGAPAVPVVLYGNRAYDDALVELRDILEDGGLHTVAAAAFIGEHSFSYLLAGGRPDRADFNKAVSFAGMVADKITNLSDSLMISPIYVEGTPKPYRGYYRPRDRRGYPVDIRKVKPLTYKSCTKCLTCAEVCPMGSISFENPCDIPGICIKCGACIKKCPVQAKYYADEAYLYHKQELEAGYKRRAEPEIFI